jgi:Bacterial Ig-like domain (group 2)
MKRLFLCAVALDAQSISITQPTAGASITGYAGYQFQVSLTSAPSVTRVCYTVDAYAAYDPGINAATTLGCSLSPPFSYPYNSYWNPNGSHQVIATAYNSTNGVVATSAAVQFTTANTWPVACTDGSAPSMTVSTGTAVTSNWSGQVNVTPAVSGSCSTDSKVFNFFVDGILQGNSGTTTAASYTYSIDTTQFLNGTAGSPTHNVYVTWNDITNASSYGGSVNCSTGPGTNCVYAAGEWGATIAFQNGTTATNQAVTNSDKIYLVPDATFTLTAAIRNTDNTPTSGSPIFQSSNTAVATVNQTTGVITAVAKGNANITAMVPNLSGATLKTNGSVCSEVSIASGGAFYASMNGWLIDITGGSGWIPGVYTITAASNSSGTAILVQNGVDTCPAPAGATGGQFATGPTRAGWVFVWPTNTMPCFGPNGRIYSTYNTSCFVVHEMFSSNNLLIADPPFVPGVAAYLNSSGINTFEIGAPYTAITGVESPSGQSAWQAGEASYIATWEGYLNGYSNLGFWLTGDNFVSSGTNLWGSTNGPAGQWASPPLTLSLEAWNAYGNVRGNSMLDEVHWGSAPLQGPLSFGISSQSWLYSITASVGTCTASNGGGIPISSIVGGKFIISGSAIGGMNSVYPNVYTASSITSASFTFPCPSVANGTYGTGGTSDAGLQIQPYAGNWYTTSTTGPAYGFITYNAFAKIRTEAGAAAASFGMSWPPAGVDGCLTQMNWGGNGSQFIGSVAQVADYGDIYSENGNTIYLVSRYGANTVVNTSGNIGQTLRSLYGCYNPSLPFVALTTATAIGEGTGGYGLQGYPAGVTSTSGNLITFSAPHGITNIIPGMTRLSISGAADSGSAVDSTNSYFYVLSAPTANTLRVAMAVPDFDVAGTGGSMSLANGNTKGLSTFAAAGAQQCGGSSSAQGICGSKLSYTSPQDATQTRNFGYTFTVSGVAGTVTTNSNCLIAGSCNLSRTFQMLAENLRPQAGGSTQLFWRELPMLLATGGTANIVTDDNYIKGRNASGEYSDLNADWAAATVFECIILRCSGERIYKADTAVSGYSAANGFSGTDAQGQVRTFADTTLGGQLFMNEHFENDNVVPIFQAHNAAAQTWNRWRNYILQPRLNSPDYGRLFDTGAAQGTYGNILMIFNASDAPETQTINTTPYLQSEQNFIQQIVNGHSIGASTTVAAGTTSVTLTIPAVSMALLVFPSDFARELLEPSIAPEISAITNAATAVILYSYDPYYLDVAGNTFNCGAATVCQPSWDRNIGTIYYRLEYLNSSGVRIAQSAVQTL